MFNETKLSKILLSLSIPPNIQGYHFTKECVKIALAEPKSLFNINMHMYPKIASQYNTTHFTIDRSIRHALKIVINEGTLCKYAESFGIEPCNSIKFPTSASFIALLVEFYKISNKSNPIV